MYTYGYTSTLTLAECLRLATFAGGVERRPLVVPVERVERLRRELQPIPIVLEQPVLQRPS